MNILLFLGHPAHYHLFKNTISLLRNKGNEVNILIKKKDILEELLDNAGVEYTNVLPDGRNDGTIGILTGLLKKNLGLYKYCKQNRPDLMAGTSAEIAHVGKLLGIPSINICEDDLSVIGKFALVTYPFTDHIFSPDTCDNGRWNKKTIFYKGYQKLAYLHPNYFTPDINVVKKYISLDRPYFLIRFAKLTAHHDKGISGIDDAVAHDLIDLLRIHGNVYVSSERMLPVGFESYRLEIDPLDIHHILAFANIFVGDSQSMSVEAAMLGTPAIRFSDFSGRIGVLEELEHKYGLTYGVRPNNPNRMFEIIEDLLSTPKLDEVFSSRRMKMLSEKIDVTAFFNWFILNYPESYAMIQNEPKYQDRFMNKLNQAAGKQTSF